MIFYLLSFFVALTTIFGLAHSQIAREKLHLKKVYEWSVKTVRTAQTQLLRYHILRSREADDDLVGFFEITVEQTEAPKLERSQTNSVEEIQGIRFRTEPSNVQKSWDSSSNSQQQPCNETRSKTFEDRDNFLASINASLRKLSAAANSGRINGAQLYEILLQETLKHDRNLSRQNDRIDECPENSGISGTVIEEVSEEEAKVIQASEKPKMYFGESPLEYVTHQEKQ